MGVTKQAAQKRFVAKDDPSHGFSRYSEAARQVVVNSQDEARKAGNTAITPSHLISALKNFSAGLCDATGQQP